MVSSHSRSSPSSSADPASSPVTPCAVGAPQVHRQPLEHNTAKEMPSWWTTSPPQHRRSSMVSPADHHLARRHLEPPLVLTGHTLSLARRVVTAPRCASTWAVFPTGLSRAPKAVCYSATQHWAPRLWFSNFFYNSKNLNKLQKCVKNTIILKNLWNKFCWNPL
jgi:hypothetical protein